MRRARIRSLRVSLSADVALGIIDINFGPDWDGIAQAISSGNQPPIIAFGPHLDVDGLRAAKKAGVTRVFSNGDFSKDTAAIITRYARPGTTIGRNRRISLDASELSA